MTRRFDRLPSYGPGAALARLLMSLSAFHRAIIPSHGLSLGQYWGLRFVAVHEPVRMSALARIALVSRPTATAFVDGMERRGWIRRGRSPTDRRAVVLHLTPKAERVLQRIDAEQSRLFARAFARVSPSRRRQAVVWLDELGRAMEVELAIRLGKAPATAR